MTATSQMCPQCGGNLPPGRTDGLCPKCLMIQGLESSPATLPPTQSSDRDSGLPSFVAPTPAELAPHFPQLEILELIGVGGMGAVYKARQASLGRMVALKILPPEVGRDPSFAERFLREAQALAQLNHAHIVTIHDVNHTASGGLYYILMEYVDGTNLRQMIQSGALTPQQSLALVPQLCDALQYAHDEGIVHRDIKPENILVDKRGRAKIADFGLAKMLGDRVLNTSLTGTQQVMGTLRYMAPEQMLGARDVDHRADIYALGVVFYELLTGDLPMGRFPLPSEKSRCDLRLDEVVLHALERERDRRYQQAKEIKTDVEHISSSYKAGNGKAAHPPVPSLKSPQPVALPQPALAISDEDFENAVDDVRPAANAMIAMGVLQLLLSAGVIGAGVFGLFVDRYPGPTDMYPGLIFAGICHLILPLILIPAGFQMRAMRSHEFAQIASVIALLPLQFTCFLTAPIGLWSLLVLMRPSVKAAFRLPTRQRPENWRASDAEVLERGASDDPAFQRAMERTSNKVKAAAIGQFIMGILDILGGILLPIALINSNPMNAAPLAVLLIVSLLPIVAGIVVLAGAIPMLRLRAYPLAVMSAIAVIMPFGALWPIRWIFGVWALVTLLRRDVRLAFAIWRKERREIASQPRGSGTSIVEKTPPIPAAVYDASQAGQEPQRIDPPLLMLTIGMVCGGLLIAAGCAMVPLAFAFASPGSGGFWGFIGAAIGCAGGGLGTLGGCWNDYRQKTGRQNLLAEPEWTYFDEVVWLYGLLGALLLAAAPVAHYALPPQGQSAWALSLLGGIVFGQGLLFAVMRVSMRSQARAALGLTEPKAEDAWGLWWRGRNEWFRRIVKGALCFTYIATLVLFLSCENRSGRKIEPGEVGPGQHFNEVSAGQPTPWLTITTREGHKRTSNVRFLSWSWLYACLGLAASYQYAQFKGYDQPPSRRRASWLWIFFAATWIIGALAAAAFVLTKGFDF